MTYDSRYMMFQELSPGQLLTKGIKKCGCMPKTRGQGAFAAEVLHVVDVSRRAGKIIPNNGVVLTLILRENLISLGHLKGEGFSNIMITYE